MPSNFRAMDNMTHMNVLIQFLIYSMKISIEKVKNHTLILMKRKDLMKKVLQKKLGIDIYIEMNQLSQIFFTDNLNQPFVAPNVTAFRLHLIPW
jgi:ferritin